MLNTKRIRRQPVDSKCTVEKSIVLLNSITCLALPLQYLFQFEMILVYWTKSVGAYPRVRPFCVAA